MGAQLTLVDEACMCHARRDARMNLYFELPPRPAHLQRRLCDLVRPIERRIRVARLYRSVEGRERQHLLSQYTLLQVGRQALEQVIADASTVCGCASVSELQKDVGSGEQAEEALAVELDCGCGRDVWFPVYKVEVRKRGQLVSEIIIYSPKRGVDAYRTFLYSTSTSAVQSRAYPKFEFQSHESHEESPHTSIDCPVSYRQRATPFAHVIAARQSSMVSLRYMGDLTPPFVASIGIFAFGPTPRRSAIACENLLLAAINFLSRSRFSASTNASFHSASWRLRSAGVVTTSLHLRRWRRAEAGNLKINMIRRYRFRTFHG